MSAIEKIRILFLADTHLGFDYPIRPRIVRRRRGFDFFNNFHRALKYAVVKKVDAVVHGGDLFFRTRIPVKIIKLVYSDLNVFGRHGIPVYIVPGNHENSRLPALHMLNQDIVKVFSRPSTFELTLAGRKVAFSGFPFQRKNIRDNISTMIEETGWREGCADLHLLCLHQAVQGARVGPSDYTFRYGEDVIRSKDIPGDFNAILSGHIHRQQVLRFYPESREVPVIYSGSIERTAFAEKDEQKGFYLLEFTRIAEKQWKLQKRFIQLPARPMIDIILDTNKLTEDNLDEMLHRLIKDMDVNAIARLKCNALPPDWLVRKMTAEYLRSIFPNTMNVSLSKDFYPSKRFAKPD